MDRIKNIWNMLMGKGYLHSVGCKEEVWVNSVPTILPWDTNMNEIVKVETEYGVEYHRKVDDA